MRKSESGLSMNRKRTLLISNDLRTSGSWSQCMRESETGLSMNRADCNARSRGLALAAWSHGRGLRSFVSVHVSRKFSRFPVPPAHNRAMRRRLQLALAILLVAIMAGIANSCIFASRFISANG